MIKQAIRENKTFIFVPHASHESLENNQKGLIMNISNCNEMHNQSIIITVHGTGTPFI